MQAEQEKKEVQSKLKIALNDLDRVEETAEEANKRAEAAESKLEEVER